MVTVWNFEPEGVSPLVAAGVVSTDSPESVPAASDIVIFRVLHTDAVLNYVFGAYGIAGAATADKLLIDHSTIDPAVTRAIALQLRSETGMRWVEALPKCLLGDHSDSSLLKQIHPQAQASDFEPRRSYAR